MGFVLNPYDTCVANKIINGKQCSIGYYVDDNISSHVDQQVLEDVVQMVEKEVGKITVSRGDTHTFLGMRITFNKNGTVSIEMSDYIIEVLQDFTDKLNKSATSPARPNLFEIHYGSPLLSEKRCEVFHSLVMKLMWMSQRCRLDISTAIAFLCP